MPGRVRGRRSKAVRFANAHISKSRYGAPGYGPSYLWRETEAGQLRDTDWVMTGEREKELMTAAGMLLDARRTNTPIDDLPAAVRPVTLEEAYYIQGRIALAYGEIGGWKVGAPTAEATPMLTSSGLSIVDSSKARACKSRRWG